MQFCALKNSHNSTFTVFQKVPLFPNIPTFTKTTRVDRDCLISEANMWFKSQATRGDTQAMEWFSFFVRHSFKGTSGTKKRLWPPWLVRCLFSLWNRQLSETFWEYVEKWKLKLVTRNRFHIHQEKVPNEIKEFSPLPTNLHHLFCYLWAWTEEKLAKQRNTWCMTTKIRMLIYPKIRTWMDFQNHWCVSCKMCKIVYLYGWGRLQNLKIWCQNGAARLVLSYNCISSNGVQASNLCNFVPLLRHFYQE